MDVNQPRQLLGGLTPAQFMRRHWQKKPLLVRNAVDVDSLRLDRGALVALAAQESVESRLVVADAGGRWRMRQGPFSKRQLPPWNQPLWTLLVQGVDLHLPAAHALLNAFRFVPDARLDDLMVSYASDGGGVGPHFDSYDVFLLQSAGRRRWRIGRQKDLSLVEGVPLKVLRDFVPDAEYELGPGDMLYLPPRYAHEGVALGPCMTCSIGFRAPSDAELASDLLQRLAEDCVDASGARRYRDADQAAVAHPGAIPPALLAFAERAVARWSQDPGVLARALGELLTEPKARVWFEAGSGGELRSGLRLDQRTRMMYDGDHVFINGESFRAGGRDARLMHLLADARRLDAREVAALSAEARELLQQWQEGGWLHDDP